MSSVQKCVSFLQILHCRHSHHCQSFFFTIKKEEFINLSKLIVQLFPRELLGTYYIPAVKSQPAEGKLCNAYQNYKADLRESELVPKRAKASTSRGTFFYFISFQFYQWKWFLVEKSIQLAAKSEAFKIILEEFEDFDRIVETWNFCYEERQNLLTELSTFEYVRKFPAFNLANGYELVSIHFF